MNLGFSIQLVQLRSYPWQGTVPNRLSLRLDLSTFSPFNHISCVLFYHQNNEIDMMVCHPTGYIIVQKIYEFRCIKCWDTLSPTWIHHLYNRGGKNLSSSSTWWVACTHFVDEQSPYSVTCWCSLLQFWFDLWTQWKWKNYSVAGLLLHLSFIS